MSRYARHYLTVVPTVCLLAVLVASCGADPLAAACPQVRVDSTTANLTKFREGAGRDLSDVEYQAEIVGFKGECVVDKDSAEVIMDIDFAIANGPAGKAGPVSIYYFVAIPQFFPKTEGKKVIEIKRDLPGRATAPARVKESSVRVTIPLKKDQAAAGFDVYIGLQLTTDQLEYNRTRPRS